ncbi:unnamed protein product [Echinostoma caproni]|uniref:Uncharacterized protein n=1 Tax=Echinostoma caproni TaxID=27848 RepID=A0A183AW61_9TREM|nr:unnamed protein product [Echinostoma caproni]
MESLYHTTLPSLAQGYTCIECNTDVVASIPGVPRFATPVDAVFTATTVPDEGLATCASGSVDPTVSIESESNVHIDGGTGEAAKRLALSNSTVGAQYVDAAADRAKRLGLIPAGVPKSSDAHDAMWPLEKHVAVRSKDLDTNVRSGWNAVDWEKLNEISRSTRRTAGDTNVNLRMPSPPRASKRKQDLTSTSYNDSDVQAPDAEKKLCGTPGSTTTVSADEFSSTNSTPINTPSLTPFKGHPSGTPTSTPGRTLTPCSEYSTSSGLESPVPVRSRAEKRRHKPSSTNLERNYRIPPSCLTRSSLCRVVLFDHDDKLLESRSGLSPSLGEEHPVIPETAASPPQPPDLEQITYQQR